MVSLSEGKNISKEIREKGMRLFREGRVRKDMDSDRRTYFIVQGETEKHSVIHDKATGKWSCDCKYSSMKGRECSHVYACKVSEKQGL